MPKPKKPVFERPLRIRTGDTVVVISGQDRGKEHRKVLGVLPRENKVIVEGVNIQKDRQKPRGGQRASGINEAGIIEKAMPIHRSNVALVDPTAGKRTRVKMKVEGGSRVRASKSGATI